MGPCLRCWQAPPPPRPHPRRSSSSTWAHCCCAPGCRSANTRIECGESKPIHNSTLHVSQQLSLCTVFTKRHRQHTPIEFTISLKTTQETETRFCPNPNVTKLRKFAVEPWKDIQLQRRKRFVFSLKCQLPTAAESSFLKDDLSNTMFPSRNISANWGDNIALRRRTVRGETRPIRSKKKPRMWEQCSVPFLAPVPIITFMLLTHQTPRCLVDFYDALMKRANHNIFLMASYTEGNSQGDEASMLRGLQVMWRGRHRLQQRQQRCVVPTPARDFPDNVEGTSVRLAAGHEMSRK